VADEVETNGKGRKRMEKAQVVRELLDGCAVAVMRADDGEAAFRAAEALLAGGVRILEITMTVPGAVEVVRKCRKLQEALVGAGTVLTGADVTACADAGASFIVSPAFCPDVIEASKRNGLAVMSGAMTPTEALDGWRAGVDFVKIFPASRLGPKFLSDLRGPFPEMPLAPTGGLTAENAASYLEAGASVLGFGSWLVDRRAIASGRFDVITERARQVRAAIEKYREEHDE
jgi:2-dehydro-3-deoxyphosphogluconate aldolase/(4S)-4-hydroxy-2-oxoglutarate aldolase